MGLACSKNHTETFRSRHHQPRPRKRNKSVFERIVLENKPTGWGSRSPYCSTIDTSKYQ